MISTRTFDIDITDERVNSDNPMARTHRVLDPGSKGGLDERGGVWKFHTRNTGAHYFTMSIRVFGFRAKLGKAANQDDATLRAVIAWSPKGATQSLYWPDRPDSRIQSLERIGHRFHLFVAPKHLSSRRVTGRLDNRKNSWTGSFLGQW